MLVWEEQSAPNISSFLIGLWLNLTNQNTFYIVGTKQTFLDSVVVIAGVIIPCSVQIVKFSISISKVPGYLK